MPTIAGNLMVPVALLGFPALALLLFVMLPPRRAVIAAYLIGYLFLPMAGYQLSGLPNYTKPMATSLGVALGVLLFDARRIELFRPSLLDLPAVGVCLAQLLASLTNELGFYDGVAGMVNQAALWVLPYFIGRLYFTDFRAMGELAAGLAIAGLVYLPLCLYEIRLSPQLHIKLYGFYQHDFKQALRSFGLYRPTVFLQHGLAVGMFMSMSALAAVWLAATGSRRTLMGLPASLAAAALAATALLCMSFLSIMLMLLGIGALYATRVLRTPVVLVVLLALPLLYIGARTVGGWSGQELIDFAGIFGPDRGGSVYARIHSEDILWARAREKPLFGWGGWGRNMVLDEEGRETAIPDGFWIVVLGTTGFFGLACTFGSILLGPVVLLRKLPARFWSHPDAAPTAAMAVVLVLFLCDCLFNAMLSPVYMLAAGGVVSVAALPAARRPRVPIPHQPAAPRAVW